MAARADSVSRVDHDGVTLVEGATHDVRFAFTERAGGVSEDAYSSLNLGSHVGDDPFAVQENRRRALEALGAAECEHNLLVPNQVHGDHVVTVTSNGADDLENIREQIAEGCDAIVCMAREVPVMLCFADCVPVVLVAPGGFAWCTLAGRHDCAHFRQGVPSALRGGWLQAGRHLCLHWAPYPGRRVRGVPRTYGSLCRRVRVHRCLCFSYARSFRRHSRGADGRRVEASSIVDTKLSTVRQNDRFYSYRNEGGTCGRHAAIGVML